MNFQEASELIQKFKPEVLKQNSISTITEFCIPYLSHSEIKPVYRNAEFIVKEYGKIILHKLFKGIDSKNSLKFEYWSSGELQNIYEYKQSNRGSFWETITVNGSQDYIIEETRDDDKVYSSFYLNGNLKMQKRVNIKGKIIFHEEYKNHITTRSVIYSDTNKVICDCRYDSLGLPTTKRTYEYDANDNLTRYIYVAKNGEVTTDLRMRYNEQGLLIESVDIPQNVYSVLYNIDLDKLAEGDSSEGYRHRYTYDSNSLLINHEIFLAGQYGIGYEYEYKKV